jgi:hypothetical protein
MVAKKKVSGPRFKVSGKTSATEPAAGKFGELEKIRRFPPVRAKPALL